MFHSPAQLSEKAVSGGAEARLLGKWGERLAADFLRRDGWRIVETNYRCRMGEIDLIAEKGRYLVFVEVKLRKGARYGLASEAVTHNKRQRLRTTAELYLSEHPTRLQPRFDVIEVYAPQGMNTLEPGISRIENAF